MDWLILLLTALLIDAVFGEPRESLHPTAWAGKLISRLDTSSRDTVLHGAIIFFCVTATFSAGAYILITLAWNSPAGLLIGAFILKTTFSWRALYEHALPVAKVLDAGRLKDARRELSKIVGRDTSLLNRDQVVSATVESAGESGVDGILSPLFYYLLAGSIFGVPAGVSAAVLYRSVNTLDSMLGYRKEGYFRKGLISARADDIMNFIPSRILAVFVITASLISGENWRNGLRVLLRDRKKTPSPNSGNPMAAVAGSLGVRLEKAGFYVIGDPLEKLSTKHIQRALKLMTISAFIFLLSFALFYEVLYG